MPRIGYASSHGNLGRISTELGNVLLNPLQGYSLVTETQITHTGILDFLTGNETPCRHAVMKNVSVFGNPRTKLDRPIVHADVDNGCAEFDRFTNNHAAVVPKTPM